jgi:AcrR family transcriptional regulator
VTRPRPLAPARGARRRTRVRLENDERRAQLLALARQTFSEHAYDDVSMDDLARVGGISKGLLYHYYPTKRDLYVAGLREISEELIEAITSAAEAPPAERVKAGLDAYLEHVAKHSRAFVALMRGGIGSDPEVAAVIERVRTRLFDQLLARTPLAPQYAGDARFEIAMRGWIGFVEAASTDWCARPRLSRAELRDLLARVLIETVRAVAPAPA